MDLSLQQPGDHLFIRAISAEAIRIVDDWYRGPLILSASRLITDWAVTNINDISESMLQPVFDLAPDIVLLGTGARQHFLPAELMMAFYTRGIGAEVMSTQAACRTFNVLVSEERRVVAALMPPDA
jgi:uncharacterized protein